MDNILFAQGFKITKEGLLIQYETILEPLFWLIFVKFLSIP